MADFPLPGCWVHPTAHPVVDNQGRVIGATLLIRGRGVNQHVDTMRRAIPAIAKAYRTLPEGVTIEPFRDDYGQATVQIVSGSYLREQAEARVTRMGTVHRWERPSLDPETGSSQIMVLDSGDRGLFRHYEPGIGSYHAWFVGPTRRGKSAAMTTSLLDITANRIAWPVILLMGPKPGLHEWADHEAYTRNPAAAHTWLLRVDAEMTRRGLYMTKYKLDVIDPSEEWPQIPVFVDEAPQIVGNDVAMTILKKIGTIGAAMGIPLRWGSQMADYADAFGYTGGTTLRSQVQAGTVLAFASEDDLITKALDGSPAPARPFVIPRNVKGACVIYGNEHPVPERGRTVFTEHPLRAAEQWRRLPDYRLPELTAQQEDEAEDTAAVATSVASGCREAVWDLFDRIDPGESLHAGSDPIAGLIKPRGQWSRSSVYAALKRLADDRLINSEGDGKWVRL